MIECDKFPLLCLVPHMVCLHQREVGERKRGEERRGERERRGEKRGNGREEEREISHLHRNDTERCRDACAYARNIAN